MVIASAANALFLNSLCDRSDLWAELAAENCLERGNFDTFPHALASVLGMNLLGNYFGRVEPEDFDYFSHPIRAYALTFTISVFLRGGASQHVDHDYEHTSHRSS